MEIRVDFWFGFGLVWVRAESRPTKNPGHRDRDWRTPRDRDRDRDSKKKFTGTGTGTVKKNFPGQENRDKNFSKSTKNYIKIFLGQNLRRRQKFIKKMGVFMQKITQNLQISGKKWPFLATNFWKNPGQNPGSFENPGPGRDRDWQLRDRDRDSALQESVKKSHFSINLFVQ